MSVTAERWASIEPNNWDRTCWGHSETQFYFRFSSIRGPSVDATFLSVLYSTWGLKLNWLSVTHYYSVISVQTILTSKGPRNINPAENFKNAFWGNLFNREMRLCFFKFLKLNKKRKKKQMNTCWMIEKKHHQFCKY